MQASDIERSRSELADLERRFLERVAMTNRCKTGGEIGAGTFVESYTHRYTHGDDSICCFNRFFFFVRPGTPRLSCVIGLDWRVEIWKCPTASKLAAQQVPVRHMRRYTRIVTMTGD